MTKDLSNCCQAPLKDFPNMRDGQTVPMMCVKCEKDCGLFLDTNEMIEIDYLKPHAKPEEAVLTTTGKPTQSEPMGVSQWAEHGKKYGYWEFFEQEVKTTMIRNAIQGWEDRCDLIHDYVQFGEEYRKLTHAIEALKSLKP